MIGLRGPKPLNNALTAPQPTTLQGMDSMVKQGLKGLDSSGFYTNPDNWLSPDMQSGTINWGLFNPLNIPEYHKILNTAYKNQPKRPEVRNYSQNGLADFVRKSIPGFNTAPKQPKGPTYGVFKPDPKPVKPQAVMNYFDLMRRNNDANGGLMGIMDKQNQRRYDRWAGENVRTLDPNLISFRDASINQALKDLNLDYMYEGKLTDGDMMLKDKRYADVTKKYGFTPDQLDEYVDLKRKAYRTLSDPVGANWQDIKNTGDFYKKQVLPSVRRYSGYDSKYFTNLEKQASEGTRNSQKYLSPEYFALHGVTRDQNPYFNKGLIGVTNPNISNGLGYVFGLNDVETAPMQGPRKSAGMSTSNPYAKTNYVDYLKDVSDLYATDDDIAEAKKRQKEHMSQLRKKVEEGGPFDLWHESDTTLPSRIKAKGGKFRRRNSGVANFLNIAQNYLPQATEGKKSYADMGYSADDAYRDHFYFDKDKKKGLFGGGLGALLTVASFVPGPIGVAARIATAANSFANKDYIGGVLGGLGAFGKSPLGALSSKLATAANISPRLANALISGGLGGLRAVSNKGDFLKGAVGGGLGSYANSLISSNLDGALSPQLAGTVGGVAGNVLNSAIQGQKGTPLALSGITGGASGYLRGSSVEKRRKEEEERRKRSS